MGIIMNKMNFEKLKEVNRRGCKNSCVYGK